MLIKPFFENDFITMWIHEGIIFGELGMNAAVTFELAKEAVEARQSASRGKTFPILLDVRNMKSAKSGARKYLASEEASQGLSVSALLVSSKVEEIIAKMFIFVNKPAIPTKIFRDKQKALEWLKSHK